MKFLLFVFLATGAVWAQSVPQPSNPAPAQQTPAPALPELPPDTVIATFGNGQKLTVGELKSFVNVMPPQMQQSALRDRKSFIQQFILMRRLAEMAEQAKLDQTSPTKESLAFNRMYLMMNAQLQNTMASMEVPQAETEAFYEKNKDRFSQVKVKAIYVTFAAKTDGNSDGKTRTEAEALEEIQKLRGELKNGADFVKLVKEHSEDQTSAAKGGDFGTIRRSDNLPDAIRKAIFALKVGEVSEPVRQPNGFYLFRAEDISAQPFSEVHADIFDELRQAHFKQWMDETTRSLNLKFQNESLLNGGAGAPADTK